MILLDSKKHIYLLIALISCSYSFGKKAHAAKQSLLNIPEQIRPLLLRKQISQKDIPNPHWRDDACIACHKSQTASRRNIRSRSMKVLCENCHNSNTKAAFIHPTDVSISNTMWRSIPGNFKKSLNTIPWRQSKIVNCMSCHDMKAQCLKRRKGEKKYNSLFLRKGPFRDRVQLCFYCHSAKKFKRFNPHKQKINNKINRDSCALCHLNTHRSDLNNLPLRSSRDLNKLCVNCHPWRPHPGWEIARTQKKQTNHLVRPSQSMIRRMKRMKRKTGVTLPIGKSGEIDCSTCHNPHQKGIIMSKWTHHGADKPKRLRIKKSCSYCHD